MSKFLQLFLLLTLPIFAAAQTKTIDSLKQALKTEQRDTSLVKLLVKLSWSYLYSRPDTALVLAQQGLQLARKTGFKKGEEASLNVVAFVFQITGNYPKALQLHLELLKKAEVKNDQVGIADYSTNIGIVYSLQGDNLQAVAYTKRALAILESLQKQRAIVTCLINLGNCYEKLNRLDSALSYTKQAYDLGELQKDTAVIGITFNNLGNIYAKLGKSAVALQNYRSAIAIYKERADDVGLCEVYLGMAEVFQNQGRSDSSLYYAKLSLAIAQKAGFIEWVMNASQFLTAYYISARNVDSAFVYQSATIAAKDSLFSQEKAREFQSLSYEETMRQQQIEQAKAEAQTQVKFNMLFGGLGTLLIVALLLFRNNRQKQNANALLKQQKAKVESTLQELKLTQDQLVQSEKMASLGELTAGIAHEIQNPLNFINNFSDVNMELIAEMKEEINNGNLEEVQAIATDVQNNEEKINHHGKRADAIVKGMLLHSRSSKGEKEPTDINALADEYLRLSYHGLRAKDKSFNANFKTDFDESIGKIEVVPQDIGRVLLNLFTNSFYSVAEKKKAPTLKGENEYEPLVTVSTRKLSSPLGAGGLIITVRDNGTGIPQKVLDKIYQPFFTTKPTGEGTGLGLSMSYDIITKGHGGTLKVVTKEGEYAEFSITLPLN